MGYPAENVEAIWRNPLEQVKSLLEKKHKNHYKIYNLCSEREYDARKFNGRVVQFPFDDHNPPNINIIKLFCEDVKKWLSKHPDNVCAIHCKAGKGRTGTMICCYLLHAADHRSYTTAESVLEFYGRARTLDYKGVTIPSQRRYISYYSYIVHGLALYRPIKLYLTSIVLDPMPNFPINNEFHFELYQMDTDTIDSSAERIFVSKPYLFRRNGRQVRLDVGPIPIRGDVKVEFCTRVGLERVGIRTKKEFHFWFNTFFTQNNRFENKLTHSIIATAQQTRDSSPSPQQQQQQQQSDERPAAPYNNNNNNNNNNDDDDLNNLLKHSSISDEHSLTQRMSSSDSTTSSSFTPAVVSGGHSSATATLSCVAAVNSSSSSFVEKRIRHCSVPQTASSPSSSSSGFPEFAPAAPTAATAAAAAATTTEGASRTNQPPISGTKINLSLNKHQLDKASKDKTCKVYDENFCVTLFFIRPTDQSGTSWQHPPLPPNLISHHSSSSLETSSGPEEEAPGTISQSTWI